MSDRVATGKTRQFKCSGCRDGRIVVRYERVMAGGPKARAGRFFEAGILGLFFDGRIGRGTCPNCGYTMELRRLF
jgi:hypothetical protein